MNIREISKPVTAKSLNESLAKKFGARIDIDAFTTEQLQDARNRVRTSLSQVETNEGFSTVHTEEYQKSKLFLDVLNAAIIERTDVVDEAGGKKPDADGDGVPDWADKKKGKDDNAGKGKGKKPKKGVVPPQFQKNESVIKEGAEEAAELVMASKDMVDKITGWMEDTAEMQTESMLELADSIRDEMGSEKSEAFTALVKPSLEALYTSLEGTREALTGGVTLLTGEGDMPTPMGTDDEMGDEVDPEAPVDADVDVDGELDVDGDVADDFGADEVAAGGEEEAGRAKRESVERSRKLGTILSKKKS